MTNLYKPERKQDGRITCLVDKDILEKFDLFCYEERLPKTKFLEAVLLGNYKAKDGKEYETKIILKKFHNFLKKST
jgi:hypothetical protein